MNRLTAVTILFPLCIFQYANAAVVSSVITDVRALKSEAETALQVLKLYTEHYLYELYEAQDNAKSEFEKELNQTIDAAFEEIKDAAEKKVNTAKINECVDARKAVLENLKVSSSKIVENCIESQKEEEVNNLFDKLIDEISDAKKMKSSIESLEKEASDGRGVEVVKKIPSVRSSLDQLEETTNELMKDGGKLMQSIESLAKECGIKQLVSTHSSVATVKENAFACIKQA